LRIRLAQAAKATRGLALVESYEATVRSAAHPTTVNRAPRMVLSLGAVFNGEETPRKFPRLVQRASWPPPSGPTNVAKLPKLLSKA
jgi:hypothetical protein